MVTRIFTMAIVYFLLIGCAVLPLIPKEELDRQVNVATIQDMMDRYGGPYLIRPSGPYYVIMEFRPENTQSFWCVFDKGTFLLRAWSYTVEGIVKEYSRLEFTEHLEDFKKEVITQNLKKSHNEVTGAEQHNPDAVRFEKSKLKPEMYEQLKKDVEIMREEGILIIEFNTVYINEAHWTSVDLKGKENFIFGLGAFCAQEVGSDVNWVEIKGLETKTKLGEWNASGIWIYR